MTAAHAQVEKGTEEKERTPSNVHAENHFARGDSGAAQLRSIQAIPGVRQALFLDYRTGAVSGITCQLKITADCGRLDNVGLYAGREPRAADETAIGGNLARALGKRIGDSIEVTARGRTASFLVVGLTQSARYLGHTVDLTSAGFARVAPGTLPTAISVYVTDPAQNHAVLQRVKAAVGPQLVALVDQRANMDSQMGVFLTMMKILAVIIVAMTVLVLALVIGLVVDALLVSERRAFGVRKALGFTSRDLGLQTLTSLLPAIAAGAVIGVTIGALTMNRLLSLLLGGLGLVRVDFVLTPFDLSVLVAGIIGGAVASLVWAARRLRRIHPSELIA